eukprot:9568178-Alexandrium_andersonii.AAC.1
MLDLTGLRSLPSPACALDAAASSCTPSIPWLASPAPRRGLLELRLSHSIALSRPPGPRTTCSPAVVVGSGM